MKSDKLEVVFQDIKPKQSDGLKLGDKLCFKIYNRNRETAGGLETSCVSRYTTKTKRRLEAWRQVVSRYTT